MAHQEASDTPIDTLSIPYPILDSHIHLYPQSELHTLAWYTPDNPIGRQHSLQEYTSDTKSAPSLEGFIFVETDRIHDLKTGEEDGSGWEFPLVEVDWLTRIATGRPREGEGHDESQKGLCKAIVAWAPVPSGEKAIAQYVQKVKDRAGDAFPKVRGFRYLVQGKPSGTMTTEKFVEGLRYLGREGFSFDLGVDHHRDGDWIVEEALELVTRTHKDVPEEEKCTFILDHLCKPDLTLFKQTNNITEHPSFITWREAIGNLSRLSKVYVKLSGCFSEIPEDYQNCSAEKLFEVLQPWFVVILTAFRGRIMFGSDWPVCTIGMTDNAWRKWVRVVQILCEMASFSEEEQIMLWSGTAIKAYNIKELM